MNSTVRDVILILIALALLVAMFLPDSTRDAQPSTAQTPPPAAGASPSPSMATRTADSDTSSAPTMTVADDVPHRLFPLVVGTEWIYMVDGPDKWAPADIWNMKVTRVPAGNDPGEITSGFAGVTASAPIRIENEGLQFAGFPLMAPPSYLDSIPGKMTGSLLPAMRTIISDAMWQFRIEREFVYRSMGENRKIIEEDARATQVDQAQVSGPVEVVVPAGVFKAYRINWISRIEIQAGRQRQVLAALTTEPYRTDSMWFAPGVGLVKRRISYSESPKEDVTFNLLRFTRISDKQGETP